MGRFIKHIFIIILSLSITLGSIDANAQCPMCKLSAEQNLKMGGSAGKGLNRGILFMLAMPYVIVGSLGYVWLRNRRKEEDTDLDSEQ